MDSKTALARAASGLGKHTAYSSPGQTPPFAAASLPENGRLDCSGFVYWCIRFESSPPESRKVDHPLYKKVNGGWFETTAICADGLAATGFFTQIEPVVGAFLVYPDYRGADGKMHDGHIGIITEIDERRSGVGRVKKIIHCSLGAWKSKKDAVQETAPDPWLAHSTSIGVWFEGFTDTPPSAITAMALEESSPASAGGLKELPGAAPKYRSLTPGGVFSNNPFDLSQPRSIRTNNPGALNITNWQRAFPGFAGATAPDRVGNVTAIYVTPEHGIAAWHYLLTDRYKFGDKGKVELQELAWRYAGVADVQDKRVKAYVSGWHKWSTTLTATTVLDLSNDDDMVVLAHGMFGHEAGRPSPLHDDQIVNALDLKRKRQLPDK